MVILQEAWLLHEGHKTVKLFHKCHGSFATITVKCTALHRVVLQVKWLFCKRHSSQNNLNVTVLFQVSWFFHHFLIEWRTSVSLTATPHFLDLAGFWDWKKQRWNKTNNMSHHGLCVPTHQSLVAHFPRILMPFSGIVAKRQKMGHSSFLEEDAVAKKMVFHRCDPITTK